MRKLIIGAAMACVAAIFVGCGNTPRANLRTDIDTLSYALGMAQTQGLRQYMEMRLGVDTAYMDEFIKGIRDGVNASDDKKRAAYYGGIQIGQQIGNMMIKGINQELFGDDSTKSISMKNFMAGFITGTKGQRGLMTPEQAGMTAQRMMQTVKEKSLMERYGDYKKECEKFMASNKKKPGVVTLPSGVQYKVIQEGKGEIPKDTSMVEVNYEGKTIDGEVFDSSYKRERPAKMRVNQVIKGWSEALTRMPEGSVWEIYIPQELAYGTQGQRSIKPFSALIFKVELIQANAKK